MADKQDDFDSLSAAASEMLDAMRSEAQSHKAKDQAFLEYVSRDTSETPPDDSGETE